LQKLKEDFKLDRSSFEEDPETRCWKDKKGRIVIPDEALDIECRLCVIAHAGTAGHRGMNATVAALKDMFWWTGMHKEVAAFIKTCLHCMVVDGRVVPRPLGATLEATAPNMVLHFDFLELPVSYDGYKYVLVLKDGMSGFAELVPCKTCTAEEVVDALGDWFKRYGPVHQWVSDQGAHFKNKAVEGVRRVWGAQHHFVTAYCPWANGTVEVVNRMLLRVLKSMSSEKKLKPSQWTLLVKQVQAALNLQPSSRLKNLAPVTAFLALPAATPLKMFYAEKISGDLPVITVAEWSAEVQGKINDLQVSLENMHKRIVEAAASKNMRERERRSKHIPRSARPNFEVGDFVLVGRTLARANKLALKWKGPNRVVNVKS
jgi:hypothetical protein